MLAARDAAAAEATADGSPPSAEETAQLRAQAAQLNALLASRDEVRVYVCCTAECPTGFKGRGACVYVCVWGRVLYS